VNSPGNPAGNSRKRRILRAPVLFLVASALPIWSAPAQAPPRQSAPPPAAPQSEKSLRPPGTSLECANSASAQSPPVAGPHGAWAVLHVDTEDDTSRDTPECSADYSLDVSAGSSRRTSDFLTTDDVTGRRVVFRLYGFSLDARRVIGILIENGRNPTTVAFDFHLEPGDVRLVDLSKIFSPALSETCIEAFDVVATTEDGALVVALPPSKDCGPGGRWAVDSLGSPLRKITSRIKTTPLYSELPSN